MLYKSKMDVFSSMEKSTRDFFRAAFEMKCDVIIY